MPDIKLNPSERVEFYKVMSNDMMIKLATIHDKSLVEDMINENKILPRDISNVDAIIGFIVNNQTNALTRICYWNVIEIEIEEKKVEIDI